MLHRLVQSTAGEIEHAHHPDDSPLTLLQGFANQISLIGLEITGALFLAEMNCFKDPVELGPMRTLR
jgi:hypothetical protein